MSVAWATGHKHRASQHKGKRDLKHEGSGKTGKLDTLERGLVTHRPKSGTIVFLRRHRRHYTNDFSNDCHAHETRRPGSSAHYHHLPSSEFAHPRQLKGNYQLRMTPSKRQGLKDPLKPGFKGHGLLTLKTPGIGVAGNPAIRQLATNTSRQPG
ncbi:hypothetical protein ARMSODRAFT_982958 [Armillaria solidipes]|uniref:Uncharacterized protein n=1 Tax=Armillaria solidipes TaxID=1076256 RepID=A0A2H3B4M1_9AGAR|nr:hypothetical protein ARMSODRAFT_982958 [Armillaria solidipes]